MSNIIKICEKCGKETQLVNLTGGGHKIVSNCRCNTENKISPALRPLGKEN